ncbi:hypothetical protein AGLY_011758 [Aphis glycines]|uniref:CCHC-type domain-containing protein n=1 Tax=Aphis glycines TaxID=307491 RepID=A0A6G0TBB1_APHGL|nr:hypothetical protein AGLY_011758 [Aphis glycines]
MDAVKDVPGVHRLATLLADMSKTLEVLLTNKNLKLTSPTPSPSLKKPKCLVANKSETVSPGALQKPAVKDASTDTILTPSWWDSDSVFEAELATKKRRSARKTKTPGIPQDPVEIRDTEVESAMDTDAEAQWSTVVKRGSSRKKTTVSRPPAVEALPKLPVTTKPPAKSKKPPAILIRPAVGKSYSDTVRTVRSCGLSAQDIGASVTMRETRDGSLLLELAKGSKSASAAKTIAAAISSKLGDSVGKVSQLGVQTEVEILDLDAVSTADEVLEALRSAIPGEDDPAARAEREGICDVRIWPTRTGQQIATAKMSRHAASLITRVTVGWTLCRVRARTLPPERCYRCQAFGHNSRNCTGSDRTGACWRCGLTDHRMKECKTPEDRCLACELAGFPKIKHRPVSGACAARKRAAGRNINLVDG